MRRIVIRGIVLDLPTPQVPLGDVGEERASEMSVVYCSLVGVGLGDDEPDLRRLPRIFRFSKLSELGYSFFLVGVEELGGVIVATE